MCQSLYNQITAQHNVIATFSMATCFSAQAADYKNLGYEMDLYLTWNLVLIRQQTLKHLTVMF